MTYKPHRHKWGEWERIGHSRHFLRLCRVPGCDLTAGGRGVQYRAPKKAKSATKEARHAH